MLLRKKLQKKAQKGRCALSLALAEFGDSKMLPSLFSLTFGAIHYLMSPASKFITGTVLTVDSGFNAFSGV
jgi:hypothetical protein